MRQPTIEEMGAALAATELPPKEHFARMDADGLINSEGKLTKLFGGEAEPEPWAKRPPALTSANVNGERDQAQPKRNDGRGVRDCSPSDVVGMAGRRDVFSTPICLARFSHQSNPSIASQAARTPFSRLRISAAAAARRALSGSLSRRCNSVATFFDLYRR